MKQVYDVFYEDPSRGSERGRAPLESSVA